MRRIAFLAVCLLAFPAHARAGDAAVSIDNFTFTPPVLTVKPGTTVVFTNRDDIPHVIVSAIAPPSFRSKVLDTEDSYSRVFDTPGEFAYFCALHPHMQGKIVVK